MEKNDIIIIHGRDYKNMAKKVLEQADVAGDIGSRDKKVALKPRTRPAGPPPTANCWPGSLNTFRSMDLRISP